MFRRPIGRRGPGLVGTVAQTAVIAGTATAVSRGVSGAMTGHAQAKQQEQQAEQADLESQAQIAEMQAQMATLQAQQAQAAMAPPAAAAAAPAAGNDLMAQLQQLTQLNDAGALTDAEFAAAKAKLLGV